jgi:hypothetical protein
VIREWPLPPNASAAASWRLTGETDEQIYQRMAGKYAEQMRAALHE